MQNNPEFSRTKIRKSIKILAATLSLEINLKDKPDLALIPQHLEPRIPNRTGKKQGVQFSTTSIVGDQKRFMYYVTIYTPSLQCKLSASIAYTFVIYFPVIFSSRKSLTTIYRLNPIQPQRNHLIWLLCAVVIAFCATLTSPGPLRNNKGLGWAPICFGRYAMTRRLIIESKKLVYFRAKDTVFKAYISTGHPQPGRLCIRDAMRWRAPW